MSVRVGERVEDKREPEFRTSIYSGGNLSKFMLFEYPQELPKLYANERFSPNESEFGH